ncbi:TadG family pilus assembly protein [Polymorphobacter sp.]|uniref:TadG family pilus assembly protein n=1 Tax=Polymorphobacter sp. TaxID=1909290 RepID=UPI003F6FE395
MWIDRLRHNRRGAVAYVVAAALPVMLGGMAFAVDMSVYRVVHNRMQGATDAAALAALAAVVDNADASAAALASAEENVPSGFGDFITEDDVTVGRYSEATGFVPGAGADANAVRVVAVRSEGRGNAVPQIFSGLFGASRPEISVMAIAARPMNVFYEPPQSLRLDAEAGDFNELYAYCYNYAGTGTPASRRSQETLISNNLPAGQNIVTISGNVITANPAAEPVWPNCNAEGQSISFRLRNVRHAKSNPALWANPNATVEGKKPGRPEHNYYSDTVINNGTETFAFTSALVETVICNSYAQCNPTASGNVIPKGKNRFPRTAATGCTPGKFMYFGWEDRPPGQSGASGSWIDPAWTDKDYDDIAIVMKCPNSGRLGDGLVRLVR